MMELTGDEIVTNLLMDRQLDGRLVVVVEGVEDAQMLDGHIDDATSYSLFAGSKSATLQAARQALEEGVSWAVFVVDADFGMEPSELYSNVVASENYDLHMDIIYLRPDFVRRLFTAHAPVGSVSKLKARHGVDALAKVWTVVCAVAALRRLVISGHFKISTRNWTFRDIVDHLSGDFIREHLAKEAHARSGRTHPASDIASAVAGELARTTEWDSFISSHDLLGLLSELVRHFGGQVSKETMGASLRAAITCSEFQSLAAIRQINSWAANSNAGPVFTCSSRNHAA